MRTYTFHVTLPDHKGVSRKLELPADATLEWLHFAVQNAYNFNADHLYSFFMSGKAWDKSSEYTLPEDADAWDGDDTIDGSTDDNGDDFFTNATGLPDETPTGPQGLTADSLRSMIKLMQSEPQMRDLLLKLIREETGMPPMMAQMLINNMDTALNSLSTEQLDAILREGNPFGGAEDDEAFEDDESAGDVRTTKLADLNLRKGQNFLYLFDYGDEWRFNVKVHAINEHGDPDAQYPRIVESVGTAPQQYPDWEEEEEWEDEEE